MNLCNDIAIDAEYLSKVDASVDALCVYGMLLLGATVLCVSVYTVQLYIVALLACVSNIELISCICTAHSHIRFDLNDNNNENKQ